jgi:hypothetical protein
MRLPIDALKIDRSFVRGIENEDHARAVIAAVIGIAYRLGLSPRGRRRAWAELAGERGSEGRGTRESRRPRRAAAGR